MFLTDLSNLNIRINKYIKKHKIFIPFVQSPWQKWTDFGLQGNWTKGFTVYLVLLLLKLK